MNRIFLLTVIYSSLLTITACKKEHVFNRNDFPSIKQGNWWRYRNIDSINHNIDTIILTAINSVIVGDTQKIYLKEEVNGISLGISQLFISSRAVDFDGDTIVGGYHISFGAQVGQTWSLQGGQSTGNIYSYIPSFDVLGHKYSVFFVINNIDRYHGTSIHVSNVGIVQMHNSFILSGGYIADKYLQLIDYDLH